LRTFCSINVQRFFKNNECFQYIIIDTFGYQGYSKSTVLPLCLSGIPSGGGAGQAGFGIRQERDITIDKINLTVRFIGKEFAVIISLKYSHNFINRGSIIPQPKHMASNQTILAHKPVSRYLLFT